MAEDPTPYQCTAITKSVGHEEDSESSPVHQRDGVDSILNVGEIAYTHLLPNDPRQWVSLFLVPYGHGSTWFGYHQGSKLDFVPMSDVEDELPSS